MTRIEEGVVAKKDGMYWARPGEEIPNVRGFTKDIFNAEIANPKFCTKPEHMTYSGDPDIDNLAKAKLVSVRKIIKITEEDDRDTWEKTADNVIFDKSLGKGRYIIIKD